MLQPSVQTNLSEDQHTRQVSVFVLVTPMKKIIQAFTYIPFLSRCNFHGFLYALSQKQYELLQIISLCQAKDWIFILCNVPSYYAHVITEEARELCKTLKDMSVHS